ncbi:hypothetical protein [Inquilinus sp.]|uniref:hypothetical protein n=1 Tax=Inquilinus sp. TaxID=1932117 RepID=UPI0031E009B4
MIDRERERTSDAQPPKGERQRIEEDTAASIAFWNEYEARFGTPADEYCEI